MPDPNPPPKKSIAWKIVGVTFIILTIGASGLAYYYYGQTQTNISNTADANSKASSYYAQWQSDENKISYLNHQISSNQSQIQTLNAQISTDNAQIASDKTQIQTLSAQGTVDSTTIQSLTAQITTLSATIATDEILIANDNAMIASDDATINLLSAQIANLQSILGLKNDQVIATAAPHNEQQCGETSQPACQGSSACTNPSICTPQYFLPSNLLSFCSPSCYSGVLVINWTSTVAMTLKFSSSYHGSTSISMSSGSTNNGWFAFPTFANFTATGNSFSSLGFHNDSCTKDASGNYHCSAYSLQYWETFDY